jgi:hypothetical protein
MPGSIYSREDSWCSFLLDADSTPEWLEGLGQLKNPMTSGIEPATFQLVAKCLNQLCYRMLLLKSGGYVKTTGTSEYSYVLFAQS